MKRLPLTLTLSPGGKRGMVSPLLLGERIKVRGREATAHA